MILNEPVPVSKVEYLETPDKTERDVREYRVLKLANGLKALLISDLHVHSKYHRHPQENKKTNYENGTVNGEINGDDVTGKRVLQTVRCELCVNVGTFSDPPEIPGVAHLLEHMLFASSTEHQEVNQFHSFVNNRDGNSNAITGSETTIYYFEISEKYLKESLDHFVQMFIKPELSEENIDKEIETIESEFHLLAQNYERRKQQLIAKYAYKGHAAGMFSTGNKESLNVSRARLYNELVKFRERHYSAHRMTVSIQAGLTLDELEKYVVEYFGAIPSNYLPPLNFETPEETVFDLSKFHKIVRLKTTDKFCKLGLTWEMRSYHSLYKSKPNVYVKKLLNDEGRGSLISYLRKKMWATYIFCDQEEEGYTHASTYSLFCITLDVSDEGYNHIEEICDAVFSYLNMLKRVLPQKRFYDEEQQMIKIDDKFKPCCTLFANVSMWMQYYAPKDYIHRTLEYNPKEIRKFLLAFDPDRVNITVYDTKLDKDRFNLTEKWYKTKYCEEEIPKEWTSRWKTIEPLPEFQLPQPNPYLVTDLTLVAVPDNASKYPVKICDEPSIKVWHRFETKDPSPKCYMTCLLKNVYINSCPESFVMTSVLFEVIKHEISEELFPAIKSGLDLAFYVINDGIMVNVYGWRETSPLLLEKALQIFANLPNAITRDCFNICKEYQFNEYHNTLFDMYLFKKELLESLFIRNYNDTTVQHDILKEINFEKFVSFMKRILGEMEVVLYVDGNMSTEDAIKYGRNYAQIINTKQQVSSIFPTVKIIQLPLGEHCCRVKHFDTTNMNNINFSLYQTEYTGMKSVLIIEIIEMIMKDPLFRQLRHEQTLGYALCCEPAHYYGLLGLIITVYTQANKFTTTEINERIDDFIKYLKKELKTMSNQDFERTVDMLVTRKLEEINLGMEFSRNVYEIAIGRFAFDSLEKEIEICSKISIDDVRTWFDDHTLGGSNCRKLSIEIVGNKEGANDENEGILDAVKMRNQNLTKYSIQYLSDSDNQKSEKHNHYYIKSIDEFKRSLPVYITNYASREVMKLSQ